MQLDSLSAAEVQWLRPEKIEFSLKDNRGPPPKPRLFKHDKNVNGGIIQGALTGFFFVRAVGVNSMCGWVGGLLGGWVDVY